MEADVDGNWMLQPGTFAYRAFGTLTAPGRALTTSMKKREHLIGTRMLPKIWLLAEPAFESSITTFRSQPVSLVLAVLTRQPGIADFGSGIVDRV